MDIPAVLRRIRRGEQRAFSEVVQHYQRPLFGFLGRMGLDQHRAEEIAQETFMRVWGNFRQYDETVAELSTWIFAIARNLALNQLNTAAHRLEVMTGDMPETDSGHQPMDDLMAHHLRHRVRRALQSLPLAERSTIALAYVRGLELTEIARIEGCSVGALKVRLHRSKQRLREYLETGDE